MTADNPVVTGLDIGTAGVVAVMAEWLPDETWKIIGVGRTPSNGLRRGVIVHLDRTTDAVRRALADAGMMAGVEAGAVHANIGGDHIRGVNSRGVVAVSRRGGVVAPEDVARVLQAARAVPVPPDREVLHVLPQEFLVDGQGGIQDPVGMVGARLEVAVHIITASTLAVSNVQHCVRAAGFDLASLTLSSLAAATVALTERDREMGVALVDVGAGLTSVVVIVDDAICHTAATAIGGRNITNDLAIGLRTPIDAAEVMKTGAGVALPELAESEEPISVQSVGDQPPREVSQRVVAAIVGPRLEEIFQLAKNEIRKAPGGDLLTAGVVLSGGGAAIPGAAQLAERIFDLPVRVARPGGLLGLTGLIDSPTDVGAAGLVRYAGGEGAMRVRNAGLFRRAAARLSHALSELI
jgi:cell division protein FtsA